MRRHERGVTLLGWLFLLLPLAMVAYAGLRLTPLYLEYMKIARTLEQVASESKGDQVDPHQLRFAIEKHFDVDDVTTLKKDDIKITKDGSKYTLEADYKSSAPYISNISLQIEFHKVVHID